MPLLPPPTRLKALIKQAMKERVPRMYLELKGNGQLEKVLEDRAEQAQGSYEIALSEATSRALSAERNLSHQETVNELTQARNEAAREALNQAVEFFTSEPRMVLHESKAAADSFNLSTRARRPGV